MEPYEAEQQRLDTVLEKIQDAKVQNDLDRKNAEQKQADVENGWNDVRFKVINIRQLVRNGNVCTSTATDVTRT